MERVRKSRRVICTRQRQRQRRQEEDEKQKQVQGVIDVPEELIQHIQSFLPAKKAAQTSVLSKSWLHAWSTTPALKFHHQQRKLEDEEYTKKYIDWINCTLVRYFRHNIPILSFDLHFDVHDQTAVSLTDKWVRKVASKSCLKELYLTLSVASECTYTLPDEIFSSENLHTVSITKDFRILKSQILNSYDGGYTTIGTLWITRNINVVINCVNLRVLKLIVKVSEEVLNKLFSTCTLLENINLTLYDNVKTIKVKNLRYLHELRIRSSRDCRLEIYDVPSLRLFSYDSSVSSMLSESPLCLGKDPFGSLRELVLAGVVIDNPFFNIFKCGFPMLEILSLDIERCKLKTLDMTCPSLQRFDIRFKENISQIELVVSSPRLLFFQYTGEAVPSLSFPINVPDQIVLQLKLADPVNHSFFLKIRETLNLSTNFKIKIQSCRSCLTVPFNIDDVRLRVVSPATNVEKLTFDTELLSEPSVLLFDALFSICHPKYIEAYNYEMGPTLKSYLTRRVLEKKTQKDLKDVQVGDCGTQTSSWTSLTRGPLNYYSGLLFFRLTWRSLKKPASVI